MEPAVMQARQQAYLEILKWGLLAIRASAYDGKSQLCEAEADHLHNLPSLFEEHNEKRHHCYIVPERKEYLAKLERLGEDEYLVQQTRWYAQPWRVLMELALAELTAENGQTAADDGSPATPGSSATPGPPS